MEVKEEVKKQGRPWTVSRSFDTFEEANDQRTKILSEGTHEAKVKKRANEKFVVKSRKLKNGKQESN